MRLGRPQLVVRGFVHQPQCELELSVGSGLVSEDQLCHRIDIALL